MSRTDHGWRNVWKLFALLLAVRSLGRAATPADPFNQNPLISSGAPLAQFDFSAQPVGVAPAGLDTLVLNGHGPDQWTIQGDAHNPREPHTLVYGRPKESSPEEAADLSFGDEKPSGDRHAWAAALAKNTALQAGDVTVAFKVASGAEGRTGFIYRYQDPSAFYLLECDADGEFFTLYRVLKGKWKVVNRVSGIITPDGWHTLRLIFQLDTYEVFFDNELAIGGRDKKGLLAAGRIGLALSTDSSAAFNHFTLRTPALVALPSKIPSR